MTMEVKVVRSIFTKTCTIGKLYLNGMYQCFTLEDFCREDPPGSWKPTLKRPGITAIPYGRYEVTMTFSQRFGKALPLLLNVPDFEGIRIHPGNNDADTAGCILVGETKSDLNDSIGNSRIASSLLILELARAINKGKIFITIEKEITPSK